MSAAPAVIVVSPDELRTIVREAVRAELAARAEPAEWLDAQGAAELLNVHARTVTNLAKRGELRASKVGKKLLRFRRDDVLDYLERSAR